MKRLVSLFIAYLLVNGLWAQNIDSLERNLYNLPDVIFTKIDPAEKNGITYELKVKQPIDHENPEMGYFYQRAFLNHKGYDRPVVFVTEGYTCTRNYPTELSRLLDANQLAVEHRYFGESIPKEVGYEYLNLKQATSDLHRINKIFREIYQGKWVSTGISKGGVTTIFYKYYYPDDVDASVPYVAPVNKEFEEQRIYHFLDTVGDSKCRKKIYDFQINILEKSDEVMPFLRFYSMGAGLEFGYVNLGQAFELAVLEYPFSFFQWGYDCDEIPSRKATPEELTIYLLNTSNINFLSDASMVAFGSHYYQSAQEMGYYGYEIDDFKKYLKYLPKNENPHAAYVPGKHDVEFDDSLLKKIHPWLEEKGNRIIYIYGAVDTWSASAVIPSDKVDALWFMMKDKHHGSARIRNMSDNEKEQLISTLERWLEIDIKQP